MRISANPDELGEAIIQLHKNLSNAREPLESPSYAGIDLINAGDFSDTTRNLMRDNIKLVKHDTQETHKLQISNCDLRSIIIDQQLPRFYQISFQNCQIASFSNESLTPIFIQIPSDLYASSIALNIKDSTLDIVDEKGISFTIKYIDSSASAFNFRRLKISGSPNTSVMLLAKSDVSNLFLDGYYKTVNINGSKIGTMRLNTSCSNIISVRNTLIDNLVISSTDPANFQFESSEKKTLKSIYISDLSSDTSVSLSNFAIDSLVCHEISNSLNLSIEKCDIESLDFSSCNLRKWDRLYVEDCTINLLPRLPQSPREWPNTRNIKNSFHFDWYRTFNILSETAGHYRAYDLRDFLRQKGQEFRLGALPLSQWQTGLPLQIYQVLSGFGRSILRPIFWHVAGIISATLLYMSFMPDITLLGVDSKQSANLAHILVGYILAGAFPLIGPPPTTFISSAFSIVLIGHSLWSGLCLFLFTLAVRGRVKV